MPEALLQGQKTPINLLGRKERKFSLPADHEPGMKVPKGGSSCASCEYVSKDEKRCMNHHFVTWNGSNKLPEAADEYCSDWYEPKEAV